MQVLHEPRERDAHRKPGEPVALAEPGGDEDRDHRQRHRDAEVGYEQRQREPVETEDAALAAEAGQDRARERNHRVGRWAPTASLGRAFAMRVTPLLRTLIAATFAADATPEKLELIVRLILHELTETPDAPTFLPLPTGVVGRRVAEFAFRLPQPARHG